MSNPVKFICNCGKEYADLWDFLDHAWPCYYAEEQRRRAAVRPFNNDTIWRRHGYSSFREYQRDKERAYRMGFLPRSKLLP